MSGQVVNMEQAAAKRVDLGGRSGGLRERVRSLEGRMTAVEAVAADAAENAKIAAENTSELLTIAKGAKSVAGFVRKHGPKAISFGAGIMTILGIGNPELWRYISHFFG